MSLRRNALLLVLAACLLAVMGDWSGDAELARLWRLPAALLLLGLAYEAWWAARATPALEVHTASRWLLNRPMPLTFRLLSQRRSVAVELVAAAPVIVSMDRSVHALRVALSGPAQLALTGTARRLGRFDWPGMPARIAGVLGLAWWSKWFAPSHRLQVVPDVLRASERALGTGTRGTQSALRPGAGGEILQLRDYRRTDPPRAIDWKATARRGKVISRDFSEDQHLEIVLAVDAGRGSALRAGDTDRLALYANVACRFAQRASMLDDRVGLLLYADRPLTALAPARGTAAVARIRNSLAEARVQNIDADPVLAALRIRSLLRQRSLVIVLTALDEVGALAELSRAARLLLPKHLPFIAAVESEQAEQLALAQVSDELEAFRALAAQEFCSAIERNVRALRALGAAAVLARPQALEEAVLDAYLRFRQRRRV